MRYKIEIIAESMETLIRNTIETSLELGSPRSIDFIKDIESKGMASVFFTKHANIHTIEADCDQEHDDEPCTCGFDQFNHEATMHLQGAHKLGDKEKA